MTVPSVDIDFTDKQSVAVQSAATEILYGGAAGGGKSFFMRAIAIILCFLIPGLNVYLFRRIREDLIKNHMEGPSSFQVMLGLLVISGHVKIVEDEIRFWNGAKIFLCHCKDEKDRFKYLGAEIHVLLVDELTMFTERIYRFLRSRCRSPGLVIPKWAMDFFMAKFGIKLNEKIPLILCGSNPGGIGHGWVKAGWIDRLKPLEIKRMSKKEGGMLRQYVPAVLEDNPHVDADEYAGKLEGLGSDELVKAYRYGVWDIIAGAYFDNWRTDLHTIPPIQIPKGWTRYRSMDWGSYRPFSVGWWVIVDEDTWLSDLCKGYSGKDRKIPRGALIRYREWYGCAKDEEGNSIPNVGLKMDAEDVGKGIKLREAGEEIDETLSVCDPSMFREDGGPSIYERMVTIKGGGPRFRPADNSRIPGWQQVRARLNGEDSAPMLYVVNVCRDFIRTVPAIQHDENRVEDINTDSEDHAADDCRYGCMARPMSRVKKNRAISGPTPWTLDWLMAQES